MFGLTIMQGIHIPLVLEFFTKKDEIITQLTSLIEMREFNTISMSFVEEDSKLYNYPIQFEDINKMPDSNEINRN